MDWEEYYTGVTMTSMNYDTFDWTLDYFLMRNDQKEAGSEVGQYCVKECTSHKLTVKSEVD